MVVTGKYCWDICTLTTRYRHEDVVTCADEICRVSESCGTASNANACSDSGPGP